MTTNTTAVRATWLKPKAWVTPILAGCGGFIAIWVLAYARDVSDLPLLIPPFGASCVLAFGYPASPFARPKNIIGGHLIAAAVGLACCAIFGYGALGIAAGVGIAITAMMLTDTTHPPAGANPVVVALVHATPSFLIAPILVGAITIVLVGMIYNRLLAAVASSR